MGVNAQPTSIANQFFMREERTGRVDAMVIPDYKLTVDNKGSGTRFQHTFPHIAEDSGPLPQDKHLNVIYKIHTEELLATSDNDRLNKTCTHKALMQNEKGNKGVGGVGHDEVAAYGNT